MRIATNSGRRSSPPPLLEPAPRRFIACPPVIPQPEHGHTANYVGRLRPSFACLRRSRSKHSARHRQLADRRIDADPNPQEPAPLRARLIQRNELDGVRAAVEQCDRRASRPRLDDRRGTAEKVADRAQASLQFGARLLLARGPPALAPNAQSRDDAGRQQREDGERHQQLDRRKTPNFAEASAPHQFSSGGRRANFKVVTVKTRGPSRTSAVAQKAREDADDA